MPRRLRHALPPLLIVALTIGAIVGGYEQAKRQHARRESGAVAQTAEVRILPPAPATLTSVSGTVLAIKPPVLTLSISLIAGNRIVTRTVRGTVTRETALTQVDPAAVALLLPAERAKVQEQPLTFADLRVGDTLSIESNEDLQRHDRLTLRAVHRLVIAR